MSKAKAIAAVTQILNQLEPHRPLVRGLLGYPGSSVVSVPDKNNTVYVREQGNESRVFEVTNTKVAPIYNTPVTVGISNLNPGVLQVLDIDLTSFWDWNSRSAIGVHHKTHEWGSKDSNGVRVDSDVVFIQSKQIVPISVKPVGNMTVYIEAGWYSYGSSRKFWPGGYSKTFTVPSGGDAAAFELIYIDATTGFLGYIRGNTFPETAVVDYQELIPDVPVGAGSVAGILLRHDDTEITHSGIVDVRTLMHIAGYAPDGTSITGDVVVDEGSFSFGLTSIDDSDSPYSLSNTTILLCDTNAGNIIVGLPTATQRGLVYDIKNISTGSVYVTGYAAQTIDSAAIQTLSTLGKMRIAADGTDSWWIL